MEAGVKRMDRGPVTVIEPDTEERYRIPERPDEEEEGVVLDFDKIDSVMAETTEVRNVLGEIFAAEEEDAGEESMHVEEVLPRLDVRHSNLVLIFEKIESCTRSRFVQEAEQQGLMPAGALEVINDAAFELCGEPLLEGHDPVEVNRYAWEELVG